MQPFRTLEAVAVPLVVDNIDTDIIIPSREMKTVGKTGLAEGMFAGWRYTAIGGREPNPDFALNQPAYAGTQIILGGANFGCGSSREHAVWALDEYGIRCVVAPTFAPIFENNCIRNGILPLRLPAVRIAELATLVAPDPQANRLCIDLAAQTITGPDGVTDRFEIGEEPKEMLLEGLDAIDLTLKRRAEIEGWRATDRAARPWVYLDA
ncbi:MAG: 3-isopropylmalate dehydratase small subunit [Alphaproteobacteria bacterium]|nr:3-isopropylmalate dehydratase small subunit [Alphaproteobacteria bacterium]